MSLQQALTQPSAFAHDDLLEMYRRMFIIRRFEDRASRLYADGVVPGFVHLSIGQEATAVGACWSLRPSDGIVSNHRGHGHCLAKGAEPAEMFAELMGRSAGACRGLGGSMHKKGRRHPPIATWPTGPWDQYRTAPAMNTAVLNWMARRPGTGSADPVPWRVWCPVWRAAR